MSVPADGERCTASTGNGRCRRRRAPELRVCARHAAEWETAIVSSIAEAAESDWRAGAWLLERRFPERWGKTSPRPADDFLTAPAPPQPAAADDEPPASPFEQLDELTARRESRA